MLKYFISPMNLFVICFFLTFLSIFIVKVIKINLNLNEVIGVIKSYKKSDLLYKFEELNNTLLNNPFISNSWREYTETLVFKDRIIYKSNDNTSLHFDTVGESEANIYCTSDSQFFFNNNTIINRILNYQFYQSIPGLLTGMGPLGTFMYIAIGFSNIDFSTEQSTITSITQMLSNMEIAASISILAIGSALLFIGAEKALFYFLCKKPLTELQIAVNSLFTKIAPEKFLIELVKENKKQNSIIEGQFKNLTESIKTSFDTSLHTRLTPYLENIVFLLNNKPSNGAKPKNIIDELISGE